MRRLRARRSIARSASRPSMASPDWFLDARPPRLARRCRVRDRSRVPTGPPFTTWTFARSAHRAPACSNDWPTTLRSTRGGRTRRRLQGYLLGRHGHIREHLGPADCRQRRDRGGCSTRAWRPIRIAACFSMCRTTSRRGATCSQNGVRDRAAFSAHAPRPAHDARRAVARICDHRAGIRLKVCQAAANGGAGGGPTSGHELLTPEPPACSIRAT